MPGWGATPSCAGTIAVLARSGTVQSEAGGGRGGRGGGGGGSGRDEGGGEGGGTSLLPRGGPPKHGAPGGRGGPGGGAGPEDGGGSGGAEAWRPPQLVAEVSGRHGGIASGIVG